MENVVGILSMLNGEIIDDIKKTTSTLGYKTNIYVLDSADYGVPQYRKRVIIFGNSLGISIDEPHKTHSSTEQSDLFSNYLPHTTVYDAISDLPEHVFLPKEINSEISYTIPPKTNYQKEIRSNSDKIIDHSSKRMMALRRIRLALLRQGDYGKDLIFRFENSGMTKDIIDKILNDNDAYEGCRNQDKERENILKEKLKNGKTSIEELLSFIDSGGFANKFRRLSWDKPSHTLVAHMSRDCSDFVHPEYDRFISVREAARLQSFPDDFKFYGSQFSKLKQIGNAVPPKLSNAIANHLLKFVS